MQQTTNSRKRRAPGASPMAPQSSSAQDSYQYQQMSQMPDNPAFGSYDFTTFNGDQAYPDATFTDANSLSAALNQAHAPTYGTSSGPAPSTDLVRRTWNQQPVLQQTAPQEQWNGYGNGDGQQEEETEQDLDAKVAMAKRDAHGKRKQIPPFVQKLSSFLDSGNTDLIRWSDDGRSFIVIDEDEFARTLIPELFKHNNYASFVRQLNMYGFHKTVNITDGSLRQSEKARKGVKPPSMYSHPYFRKNRPDLLWLIQKPTAKPSAKRKREGDAKDGFGSDDDRQYSPGPDGGSHQNLGSGGDLTTLPRGELVTVRSELKKLQQQQNIISRMIGQLKEQNDQFYRQATAFQALHDRHENSINAILTFLATFYNRSLEGHAGQNLVNMFSNAGQKNQQPSGVVEEFNDNTPDISQQLQRYVKRPLLLPGPEQAASPSLRANSAVTEASSARASASPPNGSSWQGPPPRTATSSQAMSPAVQTDVPNANTTTQAQESDQMMSLINSVNATNASNPQHSTPTFDFSSALDHYQTANGNAPLTPQQRDDMLAMIANQHGGDSSNNNALISPTPPAMPDLNQLKQTQQQLEMLTNMQKQQDEKVQDLHRRLQPLSPTGTIPGLHGEEENPFDLTGAPGDFDPNSFFNLDYPHGGPNESDTDFDFGNPGAADDDFDWTFGNHPSGGDASGADMFQTGTATADDSAQPGNALYPQASSAGRIESVSSEANTPIALEVAAAAAAAADEQRDTPNKRLRTG